ncbi:hypothetical protein K440DRAFT_641551 [Wilcoxina mikolae CBS 423.85]|nr:hypothetical protein K440DRAFT_641551 [Wilcoxina mikolae CBS 423.85]
MLSLLLRRQSHVCYSSRNLHHYQYASLRHLTRDNGPLCTARDLSGPSLHPLALPARSQQPGRWFKCTRRRKSGGWEDGGFALSGLSIYLFFLLLPPHTGVRVASVKPGTLSTAKYNATQNKKEKVREVVEHAGVVIIAMDLISISQVCQVVGAESLTRPTISPSLGPASGPNIPPSLAGGWQRFRAFGNEVALRRRRL